MSLLDYFPKHELTWDELALWRKLILVLCAIGIFYFGQGGFQHIKIYATNPTRPVNEKGQIYRLLVMHGSVRYVSMKELKSFHASEDRAKLVGVPFMIGLLVLATAGNRRKKH